MTMTSTTTNRTGVVKLWLLNFVANAGLLAVWYFWLLIPDAHGWQVAGSGLLAVIAIVLVLWLRAGTLAWFRVAEFRKQRNIWRAYRHSLRYIPALAFWVLVFVRAGMDAVGPARLHAAVRGVAAPEDRTAGRRRATS